MKHPFILQLKKGHLEVVQSLFDSGAGMQAARSSAATALFIAARDGNLEVVQLLPEAGAY